MYINKAQFPLWHPIDFSKGNPNEGYASFLKTLDSTGGSALQRQDLDANLYIDFVNEFPFLDLLEKVPANGLVHAWDLKTGFPDALSMTETGSVQDVTSAYGRFTQPISQFGLRVGATLKNQLAVRAGGMNWSPEQEEIKGGLSGFGHGIQAAIFRKQSTDTATTAATGANGQYDANGFNGLRYVLNNVAPSANSVIVDGTAALAEGVFPLTQAIRQIVDSIVDAGGRADTLAVIGSSNGITRLQNEQLQALRFVNQTEVMPGVKVMAVMAGDRAVPVLRIPGDSIGTYIPADGHTYADLYVVDMSTLKWAYLGGPTPTVVEIPFGYNGKLQSDYIIYQFGALVGFQPKRLGRVQLKIAP